MMARAELNGDLSVVTERSLELAGPHTYFRKNTVALDSKVSVGAGLSKQNQLSRYGKLVFKFL